MTRLLPALLIASALAAEEPANLIPNGDCEQDPGKLPAGAEWKDEDGNHFLRLATVEAGKMVMVYRAINLGGAKAGELTWRMRWKDVRHGAKTWNDARIMLAFKDAKHADVKPAPRQSGATGSSDGWQTRSVRFAVPEGAVFLAVMPSLFEAEAGTLDVDDLRLVAIDPATVEAKP